MSRLALVAFALVAFEGAGAAWADADRAKVRAVHTDVGEARACLPLGGGGALVGTGGGLVRIDATGAIVGVWTRTDGLPGTRIEAIALLGDEIWIGTDAGAAKVVVGDDLTIGRTVASRPVRDLARLGTTTYLATWDGGVRTLGAAKPIRFRGAKATGPRTRTASLAVVGETLYAGTAAGLYRLAGGQLEPVAIAGLADGTAIAALEADGDTLWIATTDGLFARAADGSIKSFGGGDLRAIAVVDGAVVVAGVADGLDRVDRGRLVGLDGAPQGLSVAQTVAAHGSAVCAGGLAGAWLRASPDASWIAAADRDGPPSNDISALAADGDRLWVGTFDHGVAVREHGAWRRVEHAELDRRVNAIVVEPRTGKPSRIWIATANGLTSIDQHAPGGGSAGAASRRGTDGATITRLGRRDGLPGRGVLALALLHDGRLLVGTSYGAVIVGDGRPVRLGPKDQELGTVWAAAQDADGALWLGTTTGLYRGHEAAATWQRFSLAGGHLADDWVTALVARDRTIYAGTYKGGVARFEPGADDAITATHVGDGWVNPGGLALDGDRLLAATMDGLAILDGSTWTVVPGLPGKDTTAAVRVGATLHASTRRGLAELAPD